ncbi:ABC transporter permease [Candidatus Phycosocius spiralis]|uniref:Iron(III) ABC transporter permease n=1 Tax=Candidatus Phycosocius spiralis TaxID=2815099 RepID=A0ABQ4PY90_9PROT|nr:iron ABC transporter permease [Candidatus Phycosocius spiralis]GIU67880.1 iron(III) ABC transporter permease [Candidatus Phycosocius spiralis]
MITSDGLDLQDTDASYTGATLGYTTLVRRQHSRVKGWVLLAFVMAIPGLPVLFALAAACQPSASFSHIVDWLLTDMVWTTVKLAVISTCGACMIGVVAAWLVTAYDFWGRGLLSWTLALPLAMPAYVAAYAWGDLTGSRGFYVAVLVYITTLYPYVYLAARSAFEAQSVCALEAARLLGAGPLTRFFKIALPLARPAIGAGAALMGLEIAADFGAADHLGLSTLTTGIFKAWFSFGDLAAAARLAALLLLGVIILVCLERANRSGRVGGGASSWRSLVRVKLKGVWHGFASLGCIALLSFALIVPIGHLILLAIANGLPERSLLQPIASTAFLCILGASATLITASLSAFLAQNGKRVKACVHVASLAGYATPGAVTALGILAALTFGGHHFVAALSGPVAIFGLTYAYVARFSAAGLEPISAGLERCTRSMLEAAATLGANNWQRFLRLEAPLAVPSVFAAALIIAVEIAKELPATTLLRPFGIDTLAVRAHAYAADERLGAAAWPALAIVGLALIPTVWFSHRLSKSRAGQK